MWQLNRETDGGLLIGRNHSEMLSMHSESTSYTQGNR
ncbi:unnamed protein product [Haemonchus placei]|uniref:Uncharacterized protein n=1 Tax=Haemonchus placei TaxID=6290 RepID=A0A3P7T8T4_HAEPC|nr:unnamed protein product [Haemonchus placei]